MSNALKPLQKTIFQFFFIYFFFGTKSLISRFWDWDFFRQKIRRFFTPNLLKFCPVTFKDMQTPPPLPIPPLRSGHLDIKDAQWAKKNDGWEISYLITWRLFATGVQKGRFGCPKIQLSLKVAKFAKQIGIDLALIFCMNDFFCAILSFWDIVIFVLSEFFSSKK